VFRCQLCDTVVPKGIRSQKLVTQTRPRNYESRHLKSDEGRRSFRKFRPRGIPKFDKGGVGTEIVQELMVCPQCAEKNQDAAPDSTDTVESAAAAE